ncbi:MAG: flagellin lysine-N-methylase [Lachnospiraceae bacterium]|nr:flagellin lysine-N-methylase [Candidatus Colinaster scatohippi]
MKQIIMEWVADFSCPGGDCGLTCCTGDWRIILKDEEIEKYDSLPGEIRETICSAIDFDKKELKNHNGKCSLLDEDGYCKIVRMCGEELLSFTCTFFPRIDKVFGNIEQIGVEILCPLVAKRLLENEAIRYFETEVEDDERVTADDVQMTYCNILAYIRGCLWEILEYLPGKYGTGKVCILLNILLKLQEIFKDGNVDSEMIERILDSYSGETVVNSFFENCELMKGMYAQHANAIHNVFLETNANSILGDVLPLFKKYRPELIDNLVVWLNNKELFISDYKEYARYFTDKYPMFTEKFLNYSLFISMMGYDPTMLNRRMYVRIYEQMIIHLTTMSLWKNSGEIDDKEMGIIISMIDRTCINGGEKIIDRIYEYMKSYSDGKDGVMNLLLLFTA